MILDNKLFNEIFLRAQESPRRRMNFDLRTQAQPPVGVGNEGGKDQSQRMLNVLMTDTVIPIHRHNDVPFPVSGEAYTC